MAMILGGCMTSMVGGNSTYVSPRITRQALYEDTIVAMGQSKESKELVLLGKQKTYLITKGSNKLAYLATLEPEGIKINNDELIVLDFKNNTFTSELQVKYIPKKPTMDLYKKMMSEGYELIGYFQDKFYFKSTFTISGKIYDKSEKYVAAYNLSHGRGIRVDNLTTESDKNSETRPDKFVTVPLAITIDVITLPLQLMFLSIQNSSSNN